MGDTKFIDTHAHIYLDQFKEDIDAVIERAKENAIDKIFLPNIDSNSIESMLDLEIRYPGYCFSMMGLHPCSVNESFAQELAHVKAWLEQRKFVAIGEVGIDLYWDTSHKDKQIEAFVTQIEWAKELDIPIVIHSRESLELNISIVTEHQDGNLKGVFHCFTGTLDQAKQISDLGFYYGLGGVATFKNSEVRKLLPQLPMDNMVLETDSPYLTPAPHRGKRNEPSYVALVAENVSREKEIPIEEVAKRTTQNALDLYGIFAGLGRGE